ncbi:ankyrin repeat domain-containing protein 26-like isoform X2 [Prionailurus bengalensis]|uniref:ankyrin repeat domain-containing protein 26-like isoform X2 n=1 Tax=Prionailurus bengalensis TaxID=37029 RepID=UPI001CA9540E|nr:ankyrin repeat domain-containing protein 26-like isoform X2 [Prionailurus bengalensis]
MKRIWGFGREKGMSPLGSASGLQRQGRGVGQKNNTTDNLLLGYHVQDRDLRKIHKAAWMGNAAQVQQILFLAENGVDDRDKMNRTALHLACANGHPEVVTLLVERKCHLNLCDHENRTALMKAVQCQEEKCVNILLENGADPNIRDVSGNTALHYAAFGDNISIIEKLLLYNANTEARNKDNITPLLVAVNENKQQIVEVLVEKAANIHAEDKLKSYEIICRHKEEIMLKNSLQSSHPGSDKNAEEDSITRRSDTPVPDDSWSTSASQDFDFGSKSMSEKPNKDVPHFSGAVDQKGQRILHGQVEGSDEKAEEDSITRRSDTPVPDDSWSTSASQDFDFGTKNVPKSRIAKLLHSSWKFIKNMRPKRGTMKPGDGTLSEDNHPHSENKDMAETLSKPPVRVYGDPLPVLPSSKSLLKPSLKMLAVLGLAKSMSEKPNKDVPHVSGAVDQKGQRILHGQVEGADKNAEEDSIARLSDQPAPDDSWSTSSSQVLDFGTKSMSEKPNKDVPHVSGAVDQKGQRILHGQVEGADKNAEEDSIARLSDKPAPDDSWSTSSSQVLDFGTKYQVPLKVEEKKKHRGSDMEVSENIYDAAAAGLIPQRQNGKTDNHQLPITENKDSDRREPGLHMKKLKKGENEKGTSKGSVITPVLQKADALTGGPLQKNDGSHFSEKDQHESRPAKKISKKKNKVKKQITSMDDLVDFIQSSKTASEHCELPYSKNFMLLIEQLGMDCKDYAGFLKIQDIRVSYEKLRKLNKKHCKLLMGKMTKMDKMVSALQNELQEAKDMISRLEHQKVEWEREFCSLRCTLKQEEEEEEEEERRNTDMLYENIREKLRSKEDEYKKEVETKQQVELALRMLNTELKATKNQVVEERSDTQWQLSPEQKARVLQDGSLNNLFCKQKELEMAHKKTNSKVVARQLQQELADTLKKKSMSEASPEVTSYLRLEDETRDLKKKLAQITSQLQEEQERHGEAVRCAEEMKDHVQKLQVKNATQEATIKHQAAQIQDLENNMIKTSLLQEAQERHAEAERYAEKIKDHMLKLKVKNARQEATIKHQAAQIQDLQSNLLKASLLQEAKDREAKDIRYAEKTLEVQNARAEETIKQQAAHIHNLPSNLLKTSLADVLTTELETTSSKYLHLDAKNQVLQESLSMKAFKEECEKLESNNKKLQQEVVKLKQFMEMNMVQRSQVEQYKQEIEERARLDIVEKLHEVNLFLQAQAAARQNLDQLRENNHASMRNQMELRIKDLESQVSTMKTSPDSTKTELETYRQLYLEELKLTTSLRNKLNRAKERLSESNTNFLVERQQHQTLLRTLTMSPGLEPPYCGHFENNLVLNGNLTPRGNLVIPTLNPRPSYDDREASLWKMRQELEERITRALEEDATKFE